jgi:hypothetical protein
VTLRGLACQAVDLGSFRTILAGDSKLRNLLFTQYVAGPAVARVYEQLTKR